MDILLPGSHKELYRENAVHGTPKFPIKIYMNDFSWYVNNIIDWHWHPELEFALVLSGKVRCHINDMILEVSEGEGFFINSNIMHMETPASSEPAPLMTTVVFMPEFIGDCGSDLISKRYIKPIISDTSIKGFKLTGSSPWEQDILSFIRQLYPAAEKHEFGYELKIRNIISQIWYSLALNIGKNDVESQPLAISSGEKRIKKMLTFIHENYSSDISVEDIARAANISKSECFRCFRSIISKKPVTYLNEFRLKNAADLLINTSQQITEICFSCGFNHISYFGKMFRQYYGMTPKEFRKKSRS